MAMAIHFFIGVSPSFLVANLSGHSWIIVAYRLLRSVVGKVITLVHLQLVETTLNNPRMLLMFIESSKIVSQFLVFVESAS
jgi:hypothetical protein